MKLVVPGVYTFTGLMVGRVYLTQDEDGFSLIDTSIPPSPGRILRQLAAAGHRPEQVRRILITHAHPDHVGGLKALQAATGAAVIASALEKPVIEGKQQVPRRSDGMRPPETTYAGAAVNRVVADGDVIAESLGGLQAVFTPGHAPGHMSFWQPERRILFCGDVIFRLPRLGLPWAMLTVDMAENIRSIGKVAALAPDVVCFGHGQPLTENAAAQIRAFAARAAA